MRIRINKSIFGMLKIVTLLCVMIGAVSCDLFFEKELRQDRKLAYYRHKAYVVSDSIGSSSARIKAYKVIVAEAGEDKHLITLRKKNMLLSEIYTTIACEYYEAFRIDEAIENCNLAVMLNANNKYAYFNRGCLYELGGKDSLALDSYTKALENDDNYADAYYNRAILYEKMTDFQLAIEDYSRAIRQNPVYVADVYNNRGNTYREMNFKDKAIADYTAAIQLDSTNLLLWVNRADTYISMGMKQEALRDYNTLLILDSTNIFAIDRLKALEDEVPQLLPLKKKKLQGS